MNTMFTATARIQFTDDSTFHVRRDFDSLMTIAEAEVEFKDWAYSLKERFGPAERITLITITAPGVSGVWNY